MVNNYKIDIMIAGAQKSGTTSFMRLLAKHPGLCCHKQKEYPVFVNDEYYSKGLLNYWDEYFSHCNESSFIMAKSAGLMYSDDAIKRLKEHSPNVKLAIILRNPVDRAYSSYWYARRKGWEPIETFEGALEAGIERFGDNWLPKVLCNYKERGKYADYISKVYSLFPKENVHLFKFENFKENQMDACNKVWRELQLDGTKEVEINERKFNSAAMPRVKILNELLVKVSLPESFKSFLPMKAVRKVKDQLISLNESKFDVPPMNKRTRQRLVTYYDGHNAKLSKITGWNLKDWYE